MKIDGLILGGYETNCYVLRESDAAGDCLVVDPGLEAEELIDFLTERKLKPVAVVLTHGHIDHIAGVALLRERFGNAYDAYASRVPRLVPRLVPRSQA